MAEEATTVTLNEGQFQTIIAEIAAFMKSFLAQIMEFLAKLETSYGFEDADA